MTMSSEEMGSASSLAEKTFFTHHTCMDLIPRKSFMMRHRLAEAPMILQNLQEFSMELGHDMQVASLSTVMISGSADQSFPKTWMMSHEVLPLLEPLQGIREL